MKNKDQYRRGDYGFTPLGVFVDRYMVHSFNNGRKYHKNMLIIAADVYKELYFKVLRVTKNKRVPVDLTTMTALIPHDAMKVIAVKIIDDCGHFQELTYDAYKNLVPNPTTGCGCKACACDNEDCSRTSAMTYSTEDVELGGTVYQRVRKTRVCPNGDLVEEITEPFAEIASTDLLGVHTYNIVYKTLERRLESLEVKPCGCVAKTVANYDKLTTLCGYPVCRVPCEPTSIHVQPNRHGHYKIDEEACRIYLFDYEFPACYVEVAYISNGEECAEEIMIPDYCSEAMLAGLYLGSIRFRQGISPNDKKAARMEYAEEKQELYEFLNPIVAREFMDLQFQFHKW